MIAKMETPFALCSSHNTNCYFLILVMIFVVKSHSIRLHICWWYSHKQYLFSCYSIRKQFSYTHLLMYCFQKKRSTIKVRGHFSWRSECVPFHWISFATGISGLRSWCLRISWAKSHSKTSQDSSLQQMGGTEHLEPFYFNWWNCDENKAGVSYSFNLCTGKFISQVYFFYY